MLRMGLGRGDVLRCRRDRLLLGRGGQRLARDERLVDERKPVREHVLLLRRYGLMLRLGLRLLRRRMGPQGPRGRVLRRLGMRVPGHVRMPCRSRHVHGVGWPTRKVVLDDQRVGKR